jgi:hypothetical protein
MPAAVITTQPTRWQRRARAAGRLAVDVLLIVLHLAVAVVVLAVRIPYTLLGIFARAAATAELALSTRTGRTPFGQTAGVALAAAFVAEFTAGVRTGWHTATTTTR